MAHDQTQAITPPITQEQQDSPDAESHPPEDANDLEATELSRIRTQYSRATASYRHGSVRSSTTPATGLLRLKYAISRFWRNQISMVVAHEASRDHLALERTFLGYLRTSLAISMIGVTVAQLFRLQHAPNPNAIFGFYVLGKPLACLCQVCAIYSLLLGAYRTWRHQHAMIRGKAIAGGFELVLLGFGVFVLCLLFFVLLIAVDITKEF